NHWQVQLFCEQADARAKRHHLTGFRSYPFWKNQQVPAAICQIASEREALQESRPLRERENIEKAGDQRVAQMFHESFEQAEAFCGMPHLRKSFPAHGRCQAIAESPWQRWQHPGNIEIGYVV